MDIELYNLVNKSTFDFSNFMFFRICFRILGLFAYLAIFVDSVFTCGIRAVLNTRTYGLTDANVA